MFRKIVILLSVLGLAMAVYVVSTAKETIPAPPPSYPPSTNPFARGIAALGIVEPASRIVNVAAPEPGRVAEVFIEVNQRVTRGQPLFAIDPVPVEAELLRARAARDAAHAEVHRLESWPRPEDFPPVEAQVNEAKARLADAEQRLERLIAAREGGGASEDEETRQRFLVSVLSASLANAEAQLARMKAGSWSEDLAVARANLALREAEIRAIRMRLDHLVVRSPIDATVLKRNIEPGEYVTGGATAIAAGNRAEAPIVLGDLSEIRVRAQVDEEDMPLLRQGAPAVARVRGPLRVEIPLTMLHVEPLAGPKRQISGASTEFIDTRVVDVIFRADLRPGDPTLYSGQVVDVYIDAGESAAGAQPP